MPLTAFAAALLALAAVDGARAAAPAASCSGPAELRRRFKPGALKCPGCNVVLIDIDGLRWDRLGYAGSRGGASPFIDSLARRGIVFRRATAQSSWTHPSIVSIATSLYPAQHGVGSAGQVLKPSTPTLFSRLGAAGYRLFGHDKRPFAAMGDLVMDIGEASFDNPGFNADIANAVARMSTAAARSPSLLYIVSMDLHVPYSRVPAGETPAPGSDAARYRAFAASHGFGPQRPDVAPDDIAFVRRMYDRRLRFVDGRLERLFAALGKKELSDRTIILFFSNHGEHLFEHSLWGHGFQLHEEEVHVPLIMLHPKVGAKNAAAICQEVELIDLGPTLLDMLGVGDPRFGAGKSLLPLIEGTAGEKDFQYAFSEVFHPRTNPVRMARSAEWKLVSSRDSDQLYHMTKDPGEEDDVKVQNPAAFKELKAVLRRWEETQRPVSEPATREPSEAEKVWLRKNGYW